MTVVMKTKHEHVVETGDTFSRRVDGSRLGLLVRAYKRFTRGFQLIGAWAYLSNTGTNTGDGFNLDDWLSNRGPLTNDITYIVNLAGVARLP